jgi:hypothetical protein
VNVRTIAMSRRLRQVPKAGWIVLLIGGAVLTAILVSLLSSNRATITTQLVSLPGAESPTSIDVKYRIEKPSHAEVTCKIEAIGIKHDVVGSLIHTSPARSDTTRTATWTVTVPTSRQAVSAEISDCQIVARR